MATLLQHFLRRRASRLVPVLSNYAESALGTGQTSLAFGSGRPAPLARLVQDVITGGHWASPRGFSEDLRVVSSSLSEGDYHHVADGTLDAMVEKLEAYVEENDVDGGDVEYSQGVLTVKLGRHGTFVVNKQTPNRQIWLSSPVSGPFRFDYMDGRWIYSRDGRDLVRQLEQEIAALVGPKVQLE